MSGVPGDSILVLLPQHTLSEPYKRVLQLPELPGGRLANVTTINGVIQRMLGLFWPLIASKAGFNYPYQPPRFLTLETAQYFMAYLVRPLLEQGYFDSVTIERNRLYSQILDNMIKAALVGFPITDISERLKSAWIGDPVQLRIYDDVQTCVNAFRNFCLQGNLVDYSLQFECFKNYLWVEPICKQYLFDQYQHLIFDNVEEDTPLTHDVIDEWLPGFESALIIYDSDAGFRTFLGSDPVSAYRFRELCLEKVSLRGSYVASDNLLGFSDHLVSIIRNLSHFEIADSIREKEISYLPEDLPIYIEHQRFYPQMLDWVAEKIHTLIIEDGIDADEIVIIAPYMSDSLRFSLQNRLELLGIPVRTHRPSRSLRDEPAVKCLLTMTLLGHPEWGISPTRDEVSYSLIQAISGMDLVRADLLSKIIFRKSQGSSILTSFEEIKSDIQERITYRLGEKYEVLRNWLQDAENKLQQEDDHLEYFLSRLFGEVLSQPGFGFHETLDSGIATANLIESVRRFRIVVGPILETEGISVGKAYIQTLQDGLIADQYLLGWSEELKPAVLISPAHTFVLSNKPVEFQFWLDIGSRGWYERLDQPLAHPYVLSRNWQSGKPWTDEDEVKAGVSQLTKMVQGLVRRCRKGIFLGFSELDGQGYEERGLLVQAIHQVATSRNKE
jgi:hypothetical protein